MNWVWWLVYLYSYITFHISNYLPFIDIKQSYLQNETKCKLLIVYCLMSNATFPSMSLREQLTFDEMIMMFLLYLRYTRSWIFTVLVIWYNCPWVNMWFHSDTLSWFRTNQSLVWSDRGSNLRSTVFCVTCLRSASCVPNVASVLIPPLVFL